MEIRACGVKLHKAFPLVAKSFNEEKNYGIKAKEVDFYSEMVAWWKCADCGTEWQERVVDRVKRNYETCDKCHAKRQFNAKHREYLKANNIKPCAKEESIYVTHHELVKDWDIHRNGYLLPTDVSIAYRKPIAWKCHIDGYEYVSQIKEKLESPSGHCRVCSKRTPRPGQSFAELYPEFAEYWDTEANKLTPYDIKPSYEEIVHWKCPKCGNKYSLSVVNFLRRNDTNKCSMCNARYGREQRGIDKNKSLAKMFPEIAKEWHPTLNGNLKPEDVTAYSQRKVWWKCSKCGNEWQAYIHNRTSYGKTCCSKCNTQASMAKAVENASIKDRYPEVAKLWHPTKNGKVQPTEVRPFSKKLFWWRCELGHAFTAAPVHMIANINRCPYCNNKKLLRGFNDLQTRNPELAREWDPILNGDMTPSDVIFNESQQVWWLCPYCGEEWVETVGTRNRGRKCPNCHSRKPK